MITDNLLPLFSVIQSNLLKLTVCENRFRQLPEEGLEKAADDVQVLPSLEIEHENSVPSISHSANTYTL